MRMPCMSSLLREKLPWLALAFAFGTIGVLGQIGVGAISAASSHLSPGEHIVLGVHSYVAQLTRLLVPIGLAAMYAYPRQLTWLHYASLPVAAALLWSSWHWRHDRPPWTAAVLFYTVTILLVLQIVSAGYAYRADRFTYLPAVGVAIALAHGYQSTSRKAAARPLLTIGVAAYFAFLGISTWRQCQVWRNSESLWTAVLRSDPGIAVAHLNRGSFYHQRGDVDRAASDYDRAIALDPHYALAFNNRGRLRLETGNEAAALADIERSLSLRENPLALRNRAAIHARNQRWQTTRADLDAALALAPEYTDALRDRMILNREEQRFDEALADAAAYLRLQPRDAAVQNGRGLLLLQTGRARQALAAFDAAIALSPDDPVLYRNRALAWNELGDSERVRADNALADGLVQGRDHPPH